MVYKFYIAGVKTIKIIHDQASQFNLNIDKAYVVFVETTSMKYICIFCCKYVIIK